MSDAPAAAPAATPTATTEAKATDTTKNAAITEEALTPEELAAEESAVKEADKAAAKKAWKLKVDGKDLEIDDEEELVKRAQMGYAAEKKFQEAATLRKELGEFIQLMQTDPTEAMRIMGMDVDKFSEEHINRRIQEMQKSPEQLAQEKFQQEFEKLKKEKEALENQTREIEMSQMREQYATEIENEIHDALTKSSTLPKSPYVVKRIADALLLAHTNNLAENGNPIKVSDVLPTVEKEIKKEIQQMFASMPEELVEAVIGKDVFNRVRKKRISRLKAPETAASINSTGNDVKPTPTEPSKISQREFFKKLGSI